jgi:peptidoglycan/xylan/chitin deacetylase (PgdA/CDA1 family)
MIYAKHGIYVRCIYLLISGFFYCFRHILFYDEYIIAICYHGISSGQRNRFRKQMHSIARQIITGKKSSTQIKPKLFTKAPKVYITFDDAFENLLENAIPVLEDYQIPAIIFAVAGNLGETPRWEMPSNHPESYEKTMTADQLASLSKHHLIKIGSHTVTHPNLVEISPEQAKTELVDSKQQLEALLGCLVEDLALPYGAYNQTVLTMAQEAGYQRVYTLDPKPVNLKLGRAVIGRFSMSPDVWRIEFLLTCVGAYAWLAPWRRFIRQLKNLINRFRK